MQYRIKKKILEFSFGVRIKFDYPIVESLEFDNMLVLRLDIPTRAKYNENVFAVNSRGDVVWQIKAMSHTTQNSPYVGMSCEGNLVRLHNWDGVAADVDPQTGDIIRTVFTK